jgi:Na+/melibiose symporter-like transporter
MSQEEIEAKLQTLSEQLAHLQKEQTDTRRGWANWLQSTGTLLAVFGAAIFLGIFQSHPAQNSNLLVLTLAVMAIFMLAVAFWLWVSSAIARTGKLGPWHMSWMGTRPAE